MKIFRFEKEGTISQGMVDKDGQKRDISSFGHDINEDFLHQNGLITLAEWAKKNLESCPIISEDITYSSCVARPSKIICIGLNYAKHAKESGMEAPKEPVVFFKSTTALCGPNENVIIPRNSYKTDWEVELAVIIGKKASYVTEANAMDYVAGYCLHNDYSERAFQLERSGQWVKGKSADSFAPLGPFFVTKDEVADPHNLHLWLDLNGKRMQDSSTADLIFNIPHIVSYLSEFMTLLPGDVISTGTPEGVGMGQKPQRYLVPGDVIKLGIDGLGEQEQTAVAYAG